MEKQKIAIDSCVFFHMVKYNEISENYGANEAFIEGRKDQIAFEQIQKQLDTFLGAVLKQREQKNGKRFSFDKRLSLADSLLSNKSNAFPEEIKAQYKTLHDAYAKAKTFAFVGELYQEYKLGNVEFYLPPTAVDEINYHRDLPNKKHQGEDMFSVDAINRLASQCKKIELTSAEIQKSTILSEILRGKIEINEIENFQAAMKDDKNKNGVYGDSLIMAESALAGLPLITQNAKDFIFDKGVALDKNGNLIPTRREAIKKILEHCELDPSTLPYTVEEFLGNSAKSLNLELDMADNTTFEIFKGAKKNPEQYINKPSNHGDYEEDHELGM